MSNNFPHSITTAISRGSVILLNISGMKLHIDLLQFLLSVFVPCPSVASGVTGAKRILLREYKHAASIKYLQCSPKPQPRSNTFLPRKSGNRENSAGISNNLFAFTSFSLIFLYPSKKVSLSYMFCFAILRQTFPLKTPARITIHHKCIIYNLFFCLCIIITNIHINYA